MITTYVMAALAIALVLAAAVDVWAEMRRPEWQVGTAWVSLYLAVALVALAVYDRSWWIAAVWAVSAAFSVRSLYRAYRRRQFDAEVDEFFTA